MRKFWKVLNSSLFGRPRERFCGFSNVDNAVCRAHSCGIDRRRQPLLQVLPFLRRHPESSEARVNMNPTDNIHEARCSRKNSTSSMAPPLPLSPLHLFCRYSDFQNHRYQHHEYESPFANLRLSDRPIEGVVVADSQTDRTHSQSTPSRVSDSSPHRLELYISRFHREDERYSPESISSETSRKP